MKLLATTIGAILLLLAGPSPALVAYDCADTQAGVPYKRIDLTETERCADAARDYDHPENVTVQILQLQDDIPVEAYRCQGSLSRRLTKCGFNSITYGTTTLNNVELDITADLCRQAVKTGKLVVEGKELDVEAGRRTQVTYFSHGEVRSDGSCATDNFVVDNILYQGYYQQVHVEVVIEPVKGLMEVDSGRLRFPDGLQGKYQDEVLRDTFEGTLVWTAEARPCDSTISEIYRGIADLHHFRASTQGETGSILMVRNRGTRQYGGFWLKEAVTTCARHCYATQLRGIHVCLLQPKEEPVPLPFRREFDPTNQDLYASLAAHHLSTHLVLVDRFDQVQRQLCELDRKTLTNQLQALSGVQNQHTLLSLAGRGHRFYLAGNVGYIAKCATRTVTLATSANCTQEIPVLDGVQKRWVDAQTGVLQDFPSIVGCSGPMPIMYKLEGRWYCAVPAIHPCPAPDKLNTTITQWGPHDFTQVLDGGIFTREQLAQHKAWDRSFSAREPLLTKMTNAATAGASPPSASVGGDPTLGSVLDQADVGTISLDVTSYLFPWIPQIGWLTGHIGAFFILVVVLQTCMGGITRVAAAWYRNGCGLHLVSALCLSTFLLMQIPWTLLGFLQRHENVATRRFFRRKEEQDVALQAIQHRIDTEADAEAQWTDTEDSRGSDDEGSEPPTGARGRASAPAPARGPASGTAAAAATSASVAVTIEEAPRAPDGLYYNAGTSQTMQSLRY